jgi:hypothetical protein
MVVKLAQRNPPANESDIHALEECFGSALPFEMLELLRESDGGLPDSSHYYLAEKDLPGTNQNFTMRYLLSAGEIVETIEALGEAWPKGVLPFGEDGDGNYVCIGRVEGNDGIFLWDCSTEVFFGPLFDGIAEFANTLGRGPLPE